MGAQQLYVFSTTKDGEIQFVGEVVSENEVAQTVRINTVNAMRLLSLDWELYGELVDVPLRRCRLFTDRDRMLQAMDDTRQRRVPAHATESPDKGPPAKVRECSDWLRHRLSATPDRVARLRAEAEDKGYSAKTLYAAKAVLGLIETEEQGYKCWSPTGDASGN